MGKKIITFSGKFLDLFSMNVNDLDILDISYGLSNIARFAGQVPFYSVARHSIYVAKMLPEDLMLSGLLHDASEAYIGDIISPIKPMMKDYLEIEKFLMGLISDKWKLNTGHHLVNIADKKALEYEKSTLFFSKDYRTEDQKQTIEEFLKLFNQSSRNA